MADVVRKLPGWQPILHAYMEPFLSLPFEYGTSDCFCFVGGAVAAMTGVNPCAQFVGRYHSRFGMMRTLLQHGHRDMASALDATAYALGWHRTTEQNSRIGDIAVLPSLQINALAIRYHGGFVARSMTGLNLAPLGPSLTLWSIPE